MMGQLGPRHVRVSEFYNIILTIILLSAFVGLNYKSDRLNSFPTSASQISQFTFKHNAIYTFWHKCLGL
jgi:hypothetical protein